MLCIFLIITRNWVEAFNENLTSVHYSIVTPGIDDEIKPGEFYDNR